MLRIAVLQSRTARTSAITNITSTHCYVLSMLNLHSICDVCHLDSHHYHHHFNAALLYIMLLSLCSVFDFLNDKCIQLTTYLYIFL